MRQLEQIRGVAQGFCVRLDRAPRKFAPKPVQAPGGAGAPPAGGEMLGVAQRGKILAMARQGGAGGGGAQGEALAQRPGERRICTQDLVEQSETGAGEER